MSVLPLTPDPAPAGATASPGADPSSPGADPSLERELALVARVRAGDVQAFGQLVEDHMRRAQKVASALVGSVDEALDLSQEAFVRAFRARHTLDPRRPFYPWYYQILRRLCFNHVRDRGRRHRILLGASPWLVERAGHQAQRGRPDAATERAELRRRLSAAIDALPDHEREVFVLKSFDDLRYRDIAELLDIPMGTVMSRLYAARRRLAGLLDDPTNGPREDRS